MKKIINETVWAVKDGRVNALLCDPSRGAELAIFGDFGFAQMHQSGLAESERIGSEIVECRLSELTRTANPDARTIAEKIARELFTNGEGDMAVQLRRRIKADQYDGGWAIGPMAWKIQEILSAELPAWIPVSERLPVELDVVLITATQNDNNTMREPLAGEGYLAKGQWYWAEDEYRNMPLEVSAWQVLPKPYDPEPAEDA